MTGVHNTKNENTISKTSIPSLFDELGPYDVICGRDKAAFNNVGNRRFRVMVSIYVDRYIAAESRKEKSIIVRSVTQVILATGGRFLQRRDGNWVELNSKSTQEKVSHALRDMALSITRSSRNLPDFATRTASPTNTPVQERNRSRNHSVVSADTEHQPSEENHVGQNIWGHFESSTIQFNSTNNTQTVEEVDDNVHEPIISDDEVLQGPLAKATRGSCDSTVLSWLLEESKNLLSDTYEEDLRINK